MAKALILTEKPSVARDIAEALGGFTEHDGYWESDGFVLTFAVGHLFELLEPEELDPKYKRWTLDVLPILPEQFQLKKKKGQTDRIRTLEKLLARKDVDRVVNACDAGREGELIFREIVKFLGSEKPIERLWLHARAAAGLQLDLDGDVEADLALEAGAGLTVDAGPVYLGVTAARPYPEDRVDVLLVIGGWY